MIVNSELILVNKKTTVVHVIVRAGVTTLFRIQSEEH